MEKQFGPPKTTEVENSEVENSEVENTSVKILRNPLEELVENDSINSSIRNDSINSSIPSVGYEVEVSVLAD